MNLADHLMITFTACRDASRRLDRELWDNSSPALRFPSLARASWCCDMNQASCFLDTAHLSKQRLPEPLFRALWQNDCKLMMRELQQAGGAQYAQATNAAFTDKDEQLFDLGVYSALDHFDETAETFSNTALDATKMTEGVKSGILQLRTRLFGAFKKTSLNERMQPAQLTMLGRALHGLQDFLGHTTYVETLLWALRDKLPPYIVAGFNRAPETFFDHNIPRHKRVVLRGTADPDWDPKDAIFLPYGATAADTVLSGGRFSEMDSLYSILDLYRRSLIKEGLTYSNEDRLVSVAFALVDFPGKDLARVSVDILQEFGKFFDSIGQMFRGYGIDLLRTTLKSRFKSKAAAIDESLSILEAYGNSKANNWARAGRMAYLLDLIEQAQLDDFQAVHWDSPMRPLPRHSLLKKDYSPFGDTTDVLRFNLACSLAAAISADLLVEYFSEGSGYESIVEKYVAHPSNQDPDLLGFFATLVPRLLIPSWRVDLSN